VIFVDAWRSVPSALKAACERPRTHRPENYSGWMRHTKLDECSGRTLPVVFLQRVPHYSGKRVPVFGSCLPACRSTPPVRCCVSSKPPCAGGLKRADLECLKQKNTTEGCVFLCFYAFVLCVSSANNMWNATS
jgi:hypothetical protein